MNVLLLLILSIFISSCSITVESDRHTDSYSVYKSYLMALKTKNYELALDQLSENNRKSFLNSSTGEDFLTFFPFFSSIDTVVTNEVGYYQKEYKDRSCLTVNGYSEKNEPTTLNFELMPENGQWKFNFVHMMYHESKEEFLSQPTCPLKPN